MNRKLDIAVCGAGIGGLAVATLLSRQGHRVTLFDQYDEPRPVGSGLMLQSTGLAVLGAMGLSGRVLQLGSRLERLWGRSEPSRRTVLDVRFETLRPGHFGLGVQRQMLFDTLYQSALAEGLSLQTSRRVETVDRHTGQIGFETGQFVDGFHLVIDALGVRSPLTRSPKRELAYGALWTTLPWPADGPFEKAALEQRYRAARQMAGVMASGKTSDGAPESLTYFWSIRADRFDAWRSASLDSWKSEAKALWPQTDALLNQINSHDQMVFARYRHRTHRDPVSGPRLVHIGDAWHAASPQLGQGANMALLDAYALSLALDATNDVSLALARYRSLRQSHVGLYQLMSWLFTPVYQGDGRFTPWLRDYLAAPLSRIPPAPKLLAGMVTGAFGSPLGRLGLRD